MELSECTRCGASVYRDGGQWRHTIPDWSHDVRVKYHPQNPGEWFGYYVLVPVVCAALVALIVWEVAWVVTK